MLNWIVIGVGDITTRRVIPAILAEPRSRLYGIVTRDRAKAVPYGVQAWTTLSQALRDPAVDAVYVATPLALHAPQSLEALAAGKHVLCEKPTALNYAAACGMVDAARAAGRVLGVAFYRRSYPKAQRAKELLAAGAVGKPVMAFACAHDWFNNEDGRRPWFLDPAMAGAGPLFDTASHRIDLFNFLFGTPVRVTAQRSNVVHQEKVEDNATVLIEYECGVRGIVDVRRHSRVSRDEFRVVGTDGELEMTPLNGPELRFPGGVEALPTHSNFHYPMVENFVASVLDGAPLLASGASSIVTDWVTGQALDAAG